MWTTQWPPGHNQCFIFQLLRRLRKSLSKIFFDVILSFFKSFFKSNLEITLSESLVYKGMEEERNVLTILWYCQSLLSLIEHKTNIRSH